VPRSSIVVSDEPLSKETNYRTEFVAVLNNQPQGGFITRKPTPTVVAGDGVFFDNGGGGFFPFFQRSPEPQRNLIPQGGAVIRRGGGQVYYPGQQGAYPAQQRW
jgi:hypothetical protein